MISLFFVVSGLVAVAYLWCKDVANDSNKGLEDYRCNGHHLWDKPHGNVDNVRDSHHREGNAYKLDEHTHF